GFIAFISPAIARRLARSPSASLLASGLVGALLTLLADLAGRRVIAPTELPVGVFTALFGAPYLLWLLVRGARSGAL
ncbi:MAG: iron chelate uptake ABC transporter family permease subunit, partial [Acidimicrobiales bacterium]